MAQESSLPFRVTILGTGTSQGVPIIGCKCEVCQSSDPKDKRTRTAALISWEDTNLAIDVGPDFRQQMLRADIDHLEGILLTHEHNDHVIGLDEVRPFNFISKQQLPIYATEQVETELKKRFAYAFDADPYPGAPKIRFETISKDKPIEINGQTIIPIEVGHGNMKVLGFRAGDFAYITDAKTIAFEEFQKLAGVKVLVLNALHHREHFSHLNLEEALNLIQLIGPEKAYLTHVSHQMGKYRDINKTLPSGVELAYDGLTIDM